MKDRISLSLGNPVLLKLLKMEAQETGTTMKATLIKALESYFAHRLETRALAKASEAVFEEWNDLRDSDYDKL